MDVAWAMVWAHIEKGNLLDVTRGMVWANL